MALSVDWSTRVITVPRADMALKQSLPKEIRVLDIDAFRLELKSIEESDDGLPFPDTHRHNTEVSIGGVTLARVVEIVNGYTVTFEDGNYAVEMVGANSNLADVANVNQVSVRSANSAGLISSSGTDEELRQWVREIWQSRGLDPANPAIHEQISATLIERRVPNDGSVISQDIVDDEAGTITTTRT
ncbi:MAG: hypothetical protein AAGE52_01300 [Myxococcota bacterium]